MMPSEMQITREQLTADVIAAEYGSAEILDAIMAAITGGVPLHEIENLLDWKENNRDDATMYTLRIDPLCIPRR